jgi:cytochrome P450
VKSYSIRSYQRVVVLETFMLAMVLHPDVLAKAQAELDRIIGSHRLPDLSDRDTLPYLEAIIKETLRYVSSTISPFLPSCSFRIKLYKFIHKF